MIIYMSDILCVTKRSLCKEDFLVRIEKIAKTEAAGIILREKDLSKEEYQGIGRKGTYYMPKTKNAMHIAHIYKCCKKTCM